MDRRKNPTNNKSPKRAAGDPRETLRMYRNVRRRGAATQHRMYRRRKSRRGLMRQLRRTFMPIALAVGSLGHFFHYFFRQHFSSTLAKTVIAGMALLTAGAVAVTAWILTANNALEVFVDGEPIGFVALEAGTDVESLTEQVSNTIAVTVGANVVLGQEISLQPLRAPQDEILTRPQMVSALRDEIGFLAEGFAINVSGEDMGVLRSRESAEDLLQNLLNVFVEDDLQMAFTPEFVEDVSIQERRIAPESLESPDTVFARLNQFRGMEYVHSVAPGENLSMIASRFDMTLEELRAANPGISDTISVGQPISVSLSAPMLSVRTVVAETTTEPEPFGVETIPNEAQLDTFRRVIQEGQYGMKEVVTHITKINGVEQYRSMISETVFEPPIHEIVEVGTREHPHLRG